MEGTLWVLLCSVEGSLWVLLCSVESTLWVLLCSVESTLWVLLCSVEGTLWVLLCSVAGTLWVLLCSVEGTMRGLRSDGKSSTYRSGSSHAAAVKYNNPFMTTTLGRITLATRSLSGGDNPLPQLSSVSGSVLSLASLTWSRGCRPWQY